MKKLIVIFLIGYLLNSVILAENNRWEVNRDHSEILLNIPFLKVSNITGRFTKFKGEAIFTRDEFNDPTSFYLEIEASSIFTGNKMRDQHIKKKDFLAIKKFSKITFKSTEIIKEGNYKYNVKGKLKIRNIIDFVDAEVIVEGPVEDTWKRKNIFVKFKSMINRSKFKLNWNKSLKGSEFILGEKIHVSGVFQLQKANDKTASSAYLIPNTKSVRRNDNLRLGNLVDGEPDKKLGRSEKSINMRKKEDDFSSLSLSSNTLPNKNTAQGDVKKGFADSRKGDEKKKSLYWWSSFLYVGMLGFIGNICIIIAFKKLVLKKIKNYEETNYIGIMSDLISLSISFLYALAAWELMLT